MFCQAMSLMIPLLAAVGNHSECSNSSSGVGNHTQVHTNIMFCQAMSLMIPLLAAVGNHSECSNSSSGVGNLCNCLTGFQGNPYLVESCHDIDERTTSKPCNGTCTNLPGGYKEHSARAFHLTLFSSPARFERRSARAFHPLSSPGGFERLSARAFHLTPMNSPGGFERLSARAFHLTPMNSPGGFEKRSARAFHLTPMNLPGGFEKRSARAFDMTGTNLPGSYLWGSYLCSRPHGDEGDGKKDGSGCPPKSHINGATFLCVASGLIVPVVGCSWILWRRKQQKVIELRRDVFGRNGGPALEALLSTQTTLKIFTAEDLKNATRNYDSTLLLGNSCYEGILTPNQKVTIKKCQRHGGDGEQFARRLVALSQINHRNVVKLLGCCLETMYPVLVYESTPTNTLYGYIHDNDLACSLSWDFRLMRAAETADALASMHSAAAGPIIHGNLTSSGIILHHGCTAKVFDFASTSSHPSSHIPLATSGYLDPDYLTEGQLTNKSDVYSFGVILAELLTGKEATGIEGPQGKQNLAQYFVSLNIEDDLISVLDHRLVITSGEVEQLMEVAKLARRCLSDSSLDRPNMREVVTDLNTPRLNSY